MSRQTGFTSRGKRHIQPLTMSFFFFFNEINCDAVLPTEAPHVRSCPILLCFEEEGRGTCHNTTHILCSGSLGSIHCTNSDFENTWWVKKHTPRSTCSCSMLSGCCSPRRSPFRATEPASVVKNGLLSSERPIGPVWISGMQFDGCFRSLLSMPDVTHLHGQLKAPWCQSMKQSGLLHWTRKRWLRNCRHNAYSSVLHTNVWKDLKAQCCVTARLSPRD